MVLKALVLAVIFYIGICAFMFFRQSELIFPSHFAPKSLRYDFETFTTADGTKLEIKTFTGKQDEDVVVLFTGNAQNSILAGEVIYSAFHKNVTVEAMNYRSYGYSEGKPTEENIFADALAFTKYIQQKHAGKNLYVMGISLGTGAASYVAGNMKVSGVILKTPFDSIENVAKNDYPFLPVSLLLKHPFHSVKHLQTNNAPIAIIRAGNDTVIPPRRTQALVEKIKHIVYDHTEAGMHHTQLLNEPHHDQLKNILKVALLALKSKN